MDSLPAFASRRALCWPGSIHALWVALEPSGKIEAFSCTNGDMYKCNNIWSMLATTAGSKASSRASVTRNLAMVTHNKSTDTSNSVSLRRNTRKARGKEDGEENGGPSDGRGQPKVDGGDRFITVTVSCHRGRPTTPLGPPTLCMGCMQRSTTLKHPSPPI